MKKIMSLVLSGIMVFGVLFFGAMNPLEVNAAETQWNYEYTGTEQIFTAPYSGIYQFEIAGAQGGNAAYEGGKGGKVIVSLKLSRGDIISIMVGGQDGYNGGGNGKVSNGGGATDIRINGERIAIAGGGGGGTQKENGGAGGALEAGDNGVLYFGTTDEKTTGSAGGGGGYNGGNAGAYYTKTGAVTYTVYWDRVGSSIKTGLEEYYYSDTDKGEYNYCKADYKVTKTEPASNLSATVSGINTWNWSGSRYEAPYYFKFTSDYGNLSPIYMVDYGEMEGVPVNFTTSYTNPSATIIINNASKGGSSWFDETSCIDGTYEEGVQEGDGSCSVKILSLYNLFYQSTECINVYYEGIKVKNVYYNGVLIYQE